MISILIGTEAAGRTPRYFGVCVEVREHHERCNLWDWLADSGATVHRCVGGGRRKPIDPALVAQINDKADFDDWRARRFENPAALPWEEFTFREPVKWSGVPDGTVEKLNGMGIEPLVGMGYFPRMFPEPLMVSLSAGDLAPWSPDYPRATGPSPLAAGQWDRMPSDEECNWRAAAAAYEYYFFILWHYAREYRVSYFNMLNEPEFNYRRFHFPPELMPDPPRCCQNYGPYLNRASYYVPIAVQMAVLSRIARLAFEDVRARLEDRRQAAAMTLAGPAWAGGWEHYWMLAHPFVDLCDYHHYTPDHRVLEEVHRRVAIRVGQTPGKRTACTEYGRKGGPISVSDLLFDIGPALEAAGLMMSVLSYTRPQDPPCELATFFEFQCPATHRNYKSLVYGDMNTVDWTGQDKPINERGDAWYPSFEELQLRHPTAAYHCFRMLARCVHGMPEGTRSFPALEIGVAGQRRGVHEELRTLAVDTGRDLLVTVQNRSPESVPAIEVNTQLFAGRYRFAVIRETSRTRADEVVAQVPVEHDRVHLDLAAQSLTQLILTPLALDRVGALRLHEETFTPGGVAEGLCRHQTTRLRAMGMLDGVEHDLSQMNVVWRSSDPEGVPVYQGGLVLCLKPGGPVTIRAEIPGRLTGSDLILQRNAET